VDAALVSMQHPRAALVRHFSVSPRSYARACDHPIDDDDLRVPHPDTTGFVTDEETIRAAGKAWALLFNADSDGNEGIYSRRMPSLGGGTPFDVVLTFEDVDDASRYAGMLIATDFPEAAPTEVETPALLEFCAAGGHVLGFVKAGTIMVPPENSVEEFDWSPGESEEGRDFLDSVPSDELESARGALEALFDQDEGEETETGNKE
jgi:hypothetical protein